MFFKATDGECGEDKAVATTDKDRDLCPISASTVGGESAMGASPRNGRLRVATPVRTHTDAEMSASARTAHFQPALSIRRGRRHALELVLKYELDAAPRRWQQLQYAAWAGGRLEGVIIK